MKKIVKLISVFKNVFSLRANIFKYKDYLEEGTYIFSVGVKTIAYSNYDTNKKFVNNVFAWNLENSKSKKLLMKIINFFLSVKIKNNINKEHTLVMQDIDGNIKFFNRYKNDLLTVYTSKSSFESTLNAYEDLINIYDLALYDFDEDKLISHEILVISNNEKCNYFDLSNSILNNVKERILTTSDSISAKNLKYKLEEYKVSEFDDFLSILIELNIEMPTVYSHGDLQRSNILFGGSNTYLIDLDDYNKFSFLFDFFTLIISEHYIYKNNALLVSYIEGKYDIQLRSIFKVSNFSFNSNNRIEYLIFFMIERFVYFEVPRLYKSLRKDFDQDEFDNLIAEYLFRMNSLSQE